MSIIRTLQAENKRLDQQIVESQMGVQSAQTRLAKAQRSLAISGVVLTAVQKVALSIHVLVQPPVFQTGVL